MQTLKITPDCNLRSEEYLKTHHFTLLNFGRFILKLDDGLSIITDFKIKMAYSLELSLDGAVRKVSGVLDGL